MKPYADRIVFDADNPLFKRAYPVLLTLFCRGVLETASKQLVLAAGISILVSPIGWVMSIFRRGIHIAIVLIVWWFLRDEIASIGLSPSLVLALALVAVLYRQVYDEVTDLFLHLLIVLTGGGFLRWMCRGYLSGTGFRQYAMTKEPMSRVIGVMVNGIASSYRDPYEEIMNHYLDSNDPDSESRLIALLDAYVNVTRR